MLLDGRAKVFGFEVGINFGREDALMAQHDYTIKETAELADISFDTFKTFLYDKATL